MRLAVLSSHLAHAGIDLNVYQMPDGSTKFGNAFTRRFLARLAADTHEKWVRRTSNALMRCFR
jgi:hypothetical protein